MPVPLINNLVKLYSGLARAVQQGLLGLGQTCSGWARPMRTPHPQQMQRPWAESLALLPVPSCSLQATEPQVKPL